MRILTSVVNEIIKLTLIIKLKKYFKVIILVFQKLRVIK